MMADRNANVGLFVALAGGAALFALSASGVAQLPPTQLVPGRLVVHVLSPQGFTDRQLISPHDIILLFNEYRTQEVGPVGSTRLWTLRDRLHIREPLMDVKSGLYAQDLVTVFIKPGWRTEPYASIDTTEEVVPIWVNRSHVTAVQPTKVISQIHRGVLARLWFSNGGWLDVQLTMKQAIELFPAARQIPYKR